MLLKHAHELADFHSKRRATRSVSIEDLAQLLALWKPGVYRKEREESYFNARFVARERPSYPHPAMAAVLDPTFGHVLYADQLVDLVKLLDFDHAWAERFRRAIAVGPTGGRDVMERAIREAGARHGWSTEQSNALIALLVEHVGYLHLHGHALAMAQHVFRQACLKVNPATAPTLLRRGAEQRRLRPVRARFGGGRSTAVRLAAAATVRQSQQRPFCGRGTRERPRPSGAEVHWPRSASH